MNALRFAARLLTACLVLTAGSAYGETKEPLPADEVFLYKARADAERVYLDFDIRDGYYLYRARFGFDSGTTDGTRRR